jgi:hypothetical protein
MKRYLIALSLAAFLVQGTACSKKEDEASTKSGKKTPDTEETKKVAEPTPPKPAASAVVKETPVKDDNGIPDIPEGRSKPPTVAEWGAAREVNTQGANAHGRECTMKIVREWLKVNCQGDVTKVSDMDGFGKKGFDYFDSVKIGKSADFVLRLRKGSNPKLKIHRNDKSGNAALFVSWPSNEPKPKIVALGRAN